MCFHHFSSAAPLDAFVLMQIILCFMDLPISFVLIQSLILLVTCTTKIKMKMKMTMMNMKKSSTILHKGEHGTCEALGFDLQLDFSKFLEEARNNQASVHSSSFEKAKMEEDGTKKKKQHKSWRRSLSFWVRLQRNGRYEAAPKAESLEDTIGSGEGNGGFSGPLFGNGSRLAHLHQKLRHSASGPFSSCFTPTRAEESALPYRCIGHQSHPLNPQAFGPIYLVT